MSNSMRLRLTALATAAYAVATLVGAAATPTPVVDAAARLEALSHDAMRANITALGRLLSLLLLVPALIGALRLLPRRGAVAGTTAAVLLVLHQVAGAVACTIMAVQIQVLAPAADRRTAVIAAEWLDRSALWQVSAVPYLLGWILGFLILAIALWRAAVLPRWAAACVGIGPILHIVGGDLPWTVIGGAIVHSVGLVVLARTGFRAARGPEHESATRPTTHDPAEFMVSADAPPP